MTTQQATALIKHLERMARLPSLFFGEEGVETAVRYLGGFADAWEQLFPPATGLREQVIVERGWMLPKATGPWIDREMAEKGMTAERVIAELAAIEIEIISRSVDGGDR